MTQPLQDLLKYVSLVLRTWIVYLGFVPTAFGYLATYLGKPWEAYQLPGWLNLPVIIFFFLLATYTVWRRQELKLRELEGAAPFFELKATGWNLNVELQQRIEIAQSHLAEALDQAATIRSIPGASHIGILDLGPTSSDFQAYADKLQRYIERLRDLISGPEQFIHINIDVFNASSTYDEDISIEAQLDGESTFHREYFLRIQDMPEKPRARFVTPWDPGLLHAQEEPYRKVTAFTSKEISVELKSLRAKETQPLIVEPIYLCAPGKVTMQYKILSKGRAEPQEGQLVIDLDKFAQLDPPVELSTAS